MLPLLGPFWTGPGPFAGLTYTTKLDAIATALHHRGLAKHWTAAGSPWRGPGALRHPSGAECHSLWLATASQDVETAEAVLRLLHAHCDGAPSVVHGAVPLVVAKGPLTVAGDKALREGKRGGIQWARADAPREDLSPLEIEAAHWDITEAYTRALFCRMLPADWEWHATAPPLTLSIQSQDSWYVAEWQVPDWLPWGFPTAQYKPGSRFVGLLNGEGIISAGMEDWVRIHGAWVPTDWTWHPGHQRLRAMPRDLRKRLANVTYGLHAKPLRSARGYLCDTPEIPRDAELVAGFPIDWIDRPRKRALGRIDWAIATTARIRAAVQRAARAMQRVDSIYVDGILGMGDPGVDPLWPKVIDWRITGGGDALLSAPGIFGWKGEE